MDIQSLRRLLGGQSDDTLRTMNDEIVAELKKRRTLREGRALDNIIVGGHYEFYSSKYARTIRIKVTKTNTVSVHGTEVDANGRPTFVNWKVSPSVLTPVRSELEAA